MQKVVIPIKRREIYEKSELMENTKWSMSIFWDVFMLEVINGIRRSFKNPFSR